MSSYFKRHTFIVLTDKPCSFTASLTCTHEYTLHTRTRTYTYITHTHPSIHIHYTHVRVWHVRAYMHTCITHMHTPCSHSHVAVDEGMIRSGHAYVHTDIHTRTPQEPELFSITYSKAVHFYCSQTKLREDNVLHRSVSHSVHKGDVYPSMQWAGGVHP